MERCERRLARLERAENGRCARLLAVAWAERVAWGRLLARVAAGPGLAPQPAPAPAPQPEPGDEGERWDGLG